ncbi:MAG: LVIVD repeat-containing protein [bacterium]
MKKKFGLLFWGWFFFSLIGIVFGVYCIRPLPSPGKVVLNLPVDSAVLRSAEITFQWDDIGASCYLLQVSGDSKFKSVVVEDTIFESSLSIKLKYDGRYFWRVKAQGDNGVWGDWSEIFSFTIQRFVVVTAFKTTGYPHRLAISGERVCIADGQAGLAVFDVSNPETPAFVGSYMDSLNVAWGVAVRDSMAFVAYGYKELLILNVKRAESIKVLGVLEYPQPGYGYNLALQDSWVYIAAGAQFIAALVTDPRYPNLRFQYYYPRDCRDVVLRSRCAFVACEQLGVAAWRLDTFPPVQIGGFDTPGNARGVGVQGDYLYVADGRNGLVVIDVSEPGNMRELGGIALDGYANSILVDDTLVLVACGSAGVAVVNCVYPEKPELVAQIRTPYAYAAGITGDRNYYLICDRDWGLVVVRKEE